MCVRTDYSFVILFYCFCNKHYLKVFCFVTLAASSWPQTGGTGGTGGTGDGVKDGGDVCWDAPIPIRYRYRVPILT